MPDPTVEVEAALQEARRLLEFCKRIGILEGGQYHALVNSFTPAERAALGEGAAIRAALNDFIVRYQAGLPDWRAFCARIRVIADAYNDPYKGKLPDGALDHLLRLAAKDEQEGGPRNIWRDAAIARVVELLCAAHHLKATRNRARTSGQSACAIVAMVLNELGVGISEVGVETVWRRHRHRQSSTRC
jgi:hypothetical protein